jgi:hypothetical protein
MKRNFGKLPHPEMRQLVSDIELGETGPKIDERILKALKREKLNIFPTTSLTDALSLIPENWFWHLSHLEVVISPTEDSAGFMSRLYNTKHFSYRSYVLSNRSFLPSAICSTMVRAVYNLPTAYAVDAYMTANDEFML